jgi:hypothetical protein
MSSLISYKKVTAIITSRSILAIHSLCQKSDEGIDTESSSGCFAYSQSFGTTAVYEKEYCSSSSDQNAVKVTGGTFTMDNWTIQNQVAILKMQTVAVIMAQTLQFFHLETEP